MADSVQWLNQSDYCIYIVYYSTSILVEFYLKLLESYNGNSRK